MPHVLLCSTNRIRKRCKDQRGCRNSVKTTTTYQSSGFEVAYWRTSNGASLCKHGMEPPVVGHEILQTEDHLQLFGHNIAINVLHQFMGFVSGSTAMASDDNKIEGTVLSFARLNAFITTAVGCLRDDESGKAGSHRQKLYQDTFLSFSPQVYYGMVGVVRQFVNDWWPADLSLDNVSVDKNYVCKHPLVQWEATIEIHIPTLKRRLVAFSWKWFHDYMTSDMSVVNDCFISEVIAITNTLSLLSTHE